MTPSKPISRTRRIGSMFGLSLYVVEHKQPSPSFTKGDGYDSGRTCCRPS